MLNQLIQGPQGIRGPQGLRGDDLLFEDLTPEQKEILETIIKNLVDNPEAVEIKEVENEKTITFEVKAAEEDMGKIIGRQGKIAQSIRTVMKAVAGKKNKKVCKI